MAQFLLVQGRDPAAVRDLWDRALAAFATVHGVIPQATTGGGRMRVAHFARTLVPGPGLVEAAPGPAWTLAVGTWVTEDRAPSDGALRALGQAVLTDGDAAARALANLDGYFVVVAGNDVQCEAAIVTDRIGAQHAYLAESRGCVLVSTSSLVLAAVTGAPSDPVAVRELLAAHSVFETRSLWRGVEKLPEATWIRIRDGAVASRRRWWSFADHCWDRAPTAATPEALASSLVECVRHLGHAHPRPVFDLTGGFDSRILAGAALRAGIDFKTVVNGAPSDENVVAAGRIAEAFGFDHRNQVPGRDFPEPEFGHFERVCALGDGEANVFDYAATMLAHTNLASHAHLAVNGSFGEVCRGYWWEPSWAWFRTRGRFDARRFAASRFPGTSWADAIAPALCDVPVAEHFAGIVARSVEDLSGLRDTALGDAVYVRVRMQRWHGRIASMVSRLRPTAAPFAYRAPLELALSMHPSVRRGGACARRVVEILDERLARMPLANGAPATPIRLTNVISHAPHFAELAGRAWRRASGRRAPPPPPKVPRAGDAWRLPEMADLLDPQRMRTRDWYDAGALRALVESCRASRSAPPSTLGRVATLELAERMVSAARSAPAASTRH